MRAKLAIAAVLGGLFAAPASAGPFAALGGDRTARAPHVALQAALVLPGTIEAVRRQVDDVMSAQDFQQTEPAKSAPNEIGYTRLVDVEDFRNAADCSGLGLGNPKLWMETMVITTQPAEAGVQLALRGEFKVVLSGIVSGKPFILACKSRGVIEDRLVRALKSH